MASLETYATKLKVRPVHTDTLKNSKSPRGLPLYSRVTTMPDGKIRSCTMIEGKSGLRPYKPKIHALKTKDEDLEISHEELSAV